MTYNLTESGNIVSVKGFTHVGDGPFKVTYTTVHAEQDFVEWPEPVARPAWMSEAAGQWEAEPVPLATKAKVSYLRHTARFRGDDENIPYAGWVNKD